MNHNTKGVTGFTLKMIALCTMFVDHFAATMLEGFMEGELWQQIIYWGLRGVGRMAFPIYCFLLVEGFCHTKNIRKYLIRMFIFALASELPFDLAFNYNHKYFWKSNNVFFTLFLGLAAITLLDLYKRNRTKLHMWAVILLSAVTIIAFAALAEFVLFTDYGGAGVLAIVLIYYFHNNKALGFSLAVVALFLFASVTELPAIAMLPVIIFYNGERGRQVKYVFYAFYPVHLLLLAGLCYALGLRSGLFGIW